MHRVFFFIKLDCLEFFNLLWQSLISYRLQSLRLLIDFNKTVRSFKSRRGILDGLWNLWWVVIQSRHCIIWFEQALIFCGFDRLRFTINVHFCSILLLFPCFSVRLSLELLVQFNGLLSLDQFFVESSLFVLRFFIKHGLFAQIVQSIIEFIDVVYVNFEQYPEGENAEKWGTNESPKLIIEHIPANEGHENHLDCIGEIKRSWIAIVCAQFCAFVSA